MTTLKKAREQLKKVITQCFEENKSSDPDERAKCINELIALAEIFWDDIQAEEGFTSHTVEDRLFQAGDVVDNNGSLKDIKYHGLAAVDAIKKLYLAHGKSPTGKIANVIWRARIVFEEE